MPRLGHAMNERGLVNLSGNVQKTGIEDVALRLPFPIVQQHSAYTLSFQNNLLVVLIKDIKAINFTYL
jgi:hypothetical protein